MKKSCKSFYSISLTLILLCACNNTSSSLISSSVNTSNISSSEDISQIASILPIEEQKVKSKNNKYSNPTYPIFNEKKKPTYTADPYVIRDDDGYFYLYCTQTEVYEKEYAEFKRGPIYRSLDLVNWKYYGNVFENYDPSWGSYNAGVWAPTVIKVKDQWNYYYSLSTGGDTNPGIGVATSPTPYGPWEHHGKLFNSEEIGVTNSIDPHVFYDNDKLYMVFGSYGGLITIIELTDDGLGLQNGLEYQKENKHAIASYEIFENNNYEGSLIFKKDEKYYLLLSTGSCLSGTSSTYHVVVSTSDSLFGPYVDSRGRSMFKPNSGDVVVTPSLSGAMGVGHCGLIQDDQDNYWMIYHGYDTQSEYSDYRSLYLDQLLFDPQTSMPFVENYMASNHEEKAGPYINSLEKRGDEL